MVSGIGRSRRSHDNAFRKRISGDFCVYCGEPTDGEDHFPPHVVGRRGWLIPSCSECNFLARTCHALDFNGRAAHVQRRLRQRYASALRTPDWTSRELRDCSPSVREMVEQALHVRERTRVRLAWQAAPYLVQLLRASRAPRTL